MVVSTEGVKGKTVDLSMGPNAVSNKTYTFDKVFSPAADQTIVYEDVVLPIVNEVIHVTTEDKSHQANGNFRCLRVTIAPFSHTAKPARERHTRCPAT